MYGSITAATCEAGWILNKTAEYSFILKTLRETSLKLEALPEHLAGGRGDSTKLSLWGHAKMGRKHRRWNNFINKKQQDLFTGVLHFHQLKGWDVRSFGIYAVYSTDNFLPTFRKNLWIQSSRVKNSWLLKMGSIICPERSVTNYPCSLRNRPGERRSPEQCRSHLLRSESLKSRHENLFKI
jgi:hypothetical protein